MKKNNNQEIVNKEEEREFKTLYPFGLTDKPEQAFDLGIMDTNYVQYVPGGFSIHNIAERSHSYSTMFQTTATTQLSRLNEEVSLQIKNVFNDMYSDTNYAYNKYVKIILSYMSVNSYEFDYSTKRVTLERIASEISETYNHRSICCTPLTSVTELHANRSKYGPMMSNKLTDINYYLYYHNNIPDEVSRLVSEAYNAHVRIIDRSCYSIRSKVENISKNDLEAFSAAYRYIIAELNNTMHRIAMLTLSTLFNLSDIAVKLNGKDLGNIIAYAPMNMIDEKSIIPVDYYSFKKINEKGRNELVKRSVGFVVDGLEDFVVSKHDDNDDK